MTDPTPDPKTIADAIPDDFEIITEIIERVPLVYIALAFLAGGLIVLGAMYLMAKGIDDIAEETNDAG